MNRLCNFPIDLPSTLHRLMRKETSYVTVESDRHESDRESDALTRRPSIVTVS